MEEELISFKTAKLAKEKGFHIMPDMFFDDIDTLRSTNILKMPGCYPGSVSFVSIYQEVDVYYAPTQSDLQKWLREVHNIHITIIYDWHLFHVNIMSMQSNVSLESSLTGITPHKFTTYEEALEQGLLAALKLIKEKYEK